MAVFIEFPIIINNHKIGSLPKLTLYLIFINCRWVSSACVFFINFYAIFRVFEKGYFSCFLMIFYYFIYLNLLIFCVFRVLLKKLTFVNFRNSIKNVENRRKIGPIWNIFVKFGSTFSEHFWKIFKISKIHKSNSLCRNSLLLIIGICFNYPPLRDKSVKNDVINERRHIGKLQTLTDSPIT